MLNDLSLLNVILIISFLFLLLHYLRFLQRILKGLAKLKPCAEEKIPHEFVSIIIPFRNEEENILLNLKSIESQNYPTEKFEVIYVDDSSEDTSFEVLKQNIRRENVRVISVPIDYSVNAHKKRAVRYGIENAKGEIIVTTDADCVYHEEWLISLLSCFDSLTGFVSGPVEFHGGKKIFSKFQRLEFAGLVITGAGLIGSGQPTICNAANIAYRKKVFDEVSGFKDQMNLSSGDDELLMQKIFKDTDFKVKFCTNPNAIVRTNANKTVGDFYQQRKRWASKGLFYNDKSLVIKLILIYMFYLGLITQLLLSIIVNQVYLFSFTISVILKFFTEFIILLRGKKIIFKTLDLSNFILAQFVQIPYIIFAGFIGAFGNYLWKQRKIKR